MKFLFELTWCFVKGFGYQRGKYSPPLFPLFPFGPGIIARFRSMMGIILQFSAIPFDNGNRMSVPSFYGMQIHWNTLIPSDFENCVIIPQPNGNRLVNPFIRGFWIPLWFSGLKRIMHLFLGWMGIDFFPFFSWYSQEFWELCVYSLIERELNLFFFNHNESMGCWE